LGHKTTWVSDALDKTLEVGLEGRHRTIVVNYHVDQSRKIFDSDELTEEPFSGLGRLVSRARCQLSHSRWWEGFVLHIASSAIEFVVFNVQPTRAFR
jgi:hypothetical protein